MSKRVLKKVSNYTSYANGSNANAFYVYDDDDDANCNNNNTDNNNALVPGFSNRLLDLSRAVKQVVRTKADKNEKELLICPCKRANHIISHKNIRRTLLAWKVALYHTFFMPGMSADDTEFMPMADYFFKNE